MFFNYLLSIFINLSYSALWSSFNFMCRTLSDFPDPTLDDPGSACSVARVLQSFQLLGKASASRATLLSPIKNTFYAAQLAILDGFGKQVLLIIENSIIELGLRWADYGVHNNVTVCKMPWFYTGIPNGIGGHFKLLFTRDGASTFEFQNFLPCL
jgi:hypothetical protein